MRVAVATLLVAKAILTPTVQKLHAKSGCKQKASLLARTRLDPFCKEGIINIEMTACCQADCGECHDGSDVCSAKATNGRGSTCCPSDMLAAEAKLPSCENSKAPCAVHESVRAAPDPRLSGGRTAIDDCGEAIPDEDSRHKLATRFVHLTQGISRNSAQEANCGAYGTVAAATAACDRKDTCMGFTLQSGNPNCLLMAGNEVESVSGSGDLYLKVQGLGGRRFVFDPLAFGECTKQCDGGMQERVVKCKSCKGEEATEKDCEGLEVPLGMCSVQVAMNENAQPALTTTCNTKPCA